MVLGELLRLAAGGAYSITANQIGIPTSTGNIGDALANGMKLLTELTGMLSVVFLVYGGILFTYSQGDSGRVKKARETLLYAVVGLVLSIGAFAIVSYLTTVGK